MLLVAQWTVADVFGLTLTDIYGNPLKTTALSAINQGNNNSIQANATSTNPVQLVLNVISTNNNPVTQTIKLLTGSLVFDVLFYLGVPAIMVTGMAFIYWIFLMVVILSAIARVTM